MNVIAHKGIVVCELAQQGGLVGADLSAPDLIGETYEHFPDIIVCLCRASRPAFSI
ncbi:MAG: hypothetical protein KKF33_08520 [Alphaproteobacteria bacterium]|nr:hypothetical protein [Alphaproteobacteria bacterium]